MILFGSGTGLLIEAWKVIIALINHSGIQKRFRVLLLTDYKSCGYPCDIGTAWLGLALQTRYQRSVDHCADVRRLTMVSQINMC